MYPRFDVLLNADEFVGGFLPFMIYVPLTFQLLYVVWMFMACESSELGSNGLFESRSAETELDLPFLHFECCYYSAPMLSGAVAVGSYSVHGMNSAWMCISVSISGQ